jgi:hypothetical protein
MARHMRRRLDFVQQFIIAPYILRSHAFDGEALFERGSAVVPVKRGQVRNGSDHIIDIPAEKAGPAVIDHFRKRPMTIGDHRRPAGQSFNQGKPERFRLVGTQHRLQRV